jgi:N-methylhydantoinase A
MERDARAVVQPAVGKEKLKVIRIADFRYVGQGHEIRVTLPEGVLKATDGPKLRQAFEKLYKVLYGLIIPSMEIEAVTWSVTVSSTPPKVKRAGKPKAAKAPKPRKVRQVYDPDLGKLVTMPVYWRFDMPAGTRIKGPAIIAENETSTLVAANFHAHVDSLGYIVLDRVKGNR